jgi:murein hydrolase activator
MRHARFAVFAVAALGLVVCLFTLRLSAQQKAVIDAARATARIQALHREADILARQERTLLGELRKLEIERDLRVEEVRKLDAESAAVRTQMAATTQEISLAEAAIEAARPELNARLIDVYKLGRPGYARVMLGVSTLPDAARAARLVSALAGQDQRRVEAFRASIARLAASRSALEQQATRLQGLQTDARKAADLATAAAASRERFVRDLDERRDLNAQLVGELEAAREKLQKAIAFSTLTEPVLLPLKAFRGELDRPVAGKVLARFGEVRRNRADGATLQNGVEFETIDGAPVHAIHEGRVMYADVFAGFGQLVIVDHGGLAFSLYGYLGTMTVGKGATVSVGQSIGLSGRTPGGNPAVYFELRIDGHPVDPLQWLKGQ